MIRIHRQLALLLCGYSLYACQPTVDHIDAGLRASKPEHQLCLLPGPEKGTSDLADARRRAQVQPQRAQRWADVGWAWHQVAKAQRDPGYLLSMEACARSALLINATLSSALELIAISHLERHDFIAARDLAESLLHSNPQNAVVAGLLSDAELELGHYVQSWAAAQRQLRLSPGLPSRVRLAHLAWLHGEVDQALAHMRDGLREGAADRPKRIAWALAEVAHIYLSQGDRTRAQALFRAALERFSRLRSALHGMARIALAERQTVAARDWLGRVPSMPESVETLILMAQSYEVDGDRVSAQYWSDRALKRARLDDPVWAAKLLSRDPTQAPLAVKILAAELRTRSSVDLEAALAWAQFQSGHCATSLVLIRQAHRLRTPDPNLIWYRGMIESACGDAIEGARLRQRAKAMDPVVEIRNLMIPSASAQGAGQ